MHQQQKVSYIFIRTNGFSHNLHIHMHQQQKVPCIFTRTNIFTRVNEFSHNLQIHIHQQQKVPPIFTRTNGFSHNLQIHMHQQHELAIYSYLCYAYICIHRYYWFWVESPLTHLCKNKLVINKYFLITNFIKTINKNVDHEYNFIIIYNSRYLYGKTMLLRVLINDN
jgi:hypothetical protein